MKPEIANVNNLQVNHSQVAIKEVIWQNAEHALRAVRTPVFIQEQLVTPESVSYTHLDVYKRQTLS